MPEITNPITVRGRTIRNRIVMPPIVCFGWGGEDGCVSNPHIEQYRRRAASGIGLIIVEATCVMREGRLAVPQLGLWDDHQVEGFKRLSDAVRSEGAVILVQLHHAGRVSAGEASGEAIGPSDWKNENGGKRRYSVRKPQNRARAATVSELEQIREAFIQAAVRASDAGLDGIELHAAHGYLLSQMASSVANNRNDRYGGDPHNRIRLASEIIRGTAVAVRPKNPDFILSARMGGYEPDFEAGRAIAIGYERAGLDLLHVSSGILATPDQTPETPEGFPFHPAVHAASLIRQEVSIPVIASNEVRTLERGDWLIRNGHADMASYCRPLLADPDWARHVLQGEEPRKCLLCKGGCHWFETADNCPYPEKL